MCGSDGFKWLPFSGNHVMRAEISVYKQRYRPSAGIFYNGEDCGKYMICNDSLVCNGNECH